MAYEKTTWATGDVITAEKLNHLEDGVASAGGSGSGSDIVLVKINADFLAQTQSYDVKSCDKTFSELLQYAKQGKPILFVVYGDVLANDSVVDTLYFCVPVDCSSRIVSGTRLGLVSGNNTLSAIQVEFEPGDALPSVVDIQLSYQH